MPVQLVRSFKPRAEETELMGWGEKLKVLNVSGLKRDFRARLAKVNGVTLLVFLSSCGVPKSFDSNDISEENSDAVNLSSEELQDQNSKDHEAEVEKILTKYVKLMNLDFQLQLSQVVYLKIFRTL